ncbi:PaaI family thioesterase, partial [Aquabacterium sp.]|uniref:PaaI family thioesterase n=1 Tax=Aquabacterium sp. TaxID=1872578 RepID=UPI0019A8372D
TTAVTAKPWPATVTPALKAGVSPYVDYLNVHQSTGDGDEAPLFRLPFKPDLIGNPILPALHGGVLAGFAETAMVLHLVSTMGLSDGTPPRGVDFSIDYLRSARPVDTFAQAITIRQGSRVALVQVTVWQDDQHKPVATARGHFLLPREQA